MIPRFEVIRHSLAWATLAAAFLWSPGADAEPVTKRVLFIGNSYTVQTQPQFVGFCQADPEVTLVTSLAAVGGVDLTWHYAMRAVPVYYGGAYSLIDTLRQQPWDVVVLQEFSTLPTRIGDVGRFMLAASSLATLIRTEAPTASIWMFETWARRSDNQVYPLQFANPAEMQSDLRSAYRDAAAAIGASVVPVGDAWERVSVLRPYTPGGGGGGQNEGNPAGYSMHIGDGSHPNDRGRYLTGAVFFETLFQRSSAARGYRGSVSCADATFLRRVASDITGVPAAPNPPSNCCPGDCTGDGLVDFRDLNIVLTVFGLRCS